MSASLSTPFLPWLQLCWLKHVAAICCWTHPSAAGARPHLDFSSQTLVIILAASPLRQFWLPKYFFVRNRRQLKLPPSPTGFGPSLDQLWSGAWAGLRLQGPHLASAFADVAQCTQRNTSGNRRLRGYSPWEHLQKQYSCYLFAFSIT